MNNYQKRILAAGLVAAAILTAVYILVDWSPVIHCAYLFLLMDAGLACGALWQLSRVNKDGYLTGLAFPLALKGLLLAAAAAAVLVAALDLAGWSMPWKWFCVIEIIILGVVCWRLLAIGAGEEVIQEVGNQVKTQTAVWMMLRADTEAFLCDAPAAAQPDFTRVRDVIRYADPMSIPEVTAIETDIQARLRQMRELATQGEDTSAIARQIENLVHDRANRLKLLK